MGEEPSAGSRLEAGPAAQAVPQYAARTRAAGMACRTASPQFRRRGLWLTPRTATIAACGLILLYCVSRFLIFVALPWYWDDVIWWGNAHADGVASTANLLRDHDGHLMPGGFLVSGLLTEHLFLNRVVPGVVLVALQAAVAGGIWLLLRRILGAGLPALALLAVFLFTVHSLPAAGWWALGITVFPLQLALVVALLGAERLLRARTVSEARCGSLVVALALAVGLPFAERALAVPVLVVLVVLVSMAAQGRRDGEMPRRQWCRAVAPGVVVVAALATGYAVLYLSRVDARHFGLERHEALTVVTEGLFRGVLPAVWGGPLAWERWVPSAAWADPPGWLQVAAVLATVVAVAVGLARRRRRVWLYTAVPLVVLAGENAVMVLARWHEGAAGILPLTLRYFPATAVAAVWAVARIWAGERVPGASDAEGRVAGAEQGAGGTSGAAPAPMAVLAASAAGNRVGPVLAAVLAVVLVASGISTLSYVALWRDDPGDRYLRTAAASLQEFGLEHPGVTLLDQAVNLNVLQSVTAPAHNASRVFGPLRDRPEFAGATSELWMISDSGTVVPTELDVVRRVRGEDLEGCFAGVGTGDHRLNLSGPVMEWEWTIRLNYAASRDMEVVASVGWSAGSTPHGNPSGPVVVPLRAGTHSAFIRVVGAGDMVRLEGVPAGETVCLGDGGLGIPAPR